MATRVAIVDDHYVFRLGLKFMIESADDLVFAGEAESAVEIETFVRQVKPDVLLLDVRMPGVDGIEAMKRVKAVAPDIKVMMVTTSDTEEEVFRSMEAGATGYILKDSSAEEMETAIRKVAKGERTMSERAAEIYTLRNTSKSLSKREMEVLILVSKGCNNREIAENLQIGVETVKQLLKRIFEKLDVTDRTEAVSAAFYRGILST